jgi:hypothetical protein
MERAFSSFKLVISYPKLRLSIFSWPHCAHFEDEEHEDRLSKIEQDVLKNFADAHPKISYLIDRWASYKSQRNNSS